MMFCRIYQWRIEKELDNGGIKPKTEVHLRKCNTCRILYHRLIQLGRELETSASHQLSDVQLQQFTDAALHRLSQYSTGQISGGGHPVHTVTKFVPIWRAAAVVLIAAALFTAGHRLYRRSGLEERGNPPFNIQSFSGSILLNESYTALVSLPDQAILSEFQKLTRDAQHASAFLMSCVPAAPSQPPSSLQTN